MKVVLVDDEQLALDILERMIRKVGGIDIVGAFQDPLQALDFIKEAAVDVVFLDISLPEINGLEIAEKLIEHQSHIHIVFVTAYEEHAVKAFELNALDYLVKPFTHDRLQSTIERIQSMRHQIPKSTVNLDQEHLHIQVLGHLSFKSSENQYTSFNWRTLKAQELFLYLLHNKDLLVRKSILIELLWPDMDYERATSLLYTTVYYVRKNLRKFNNYLTLKNATEGYVLETNRVILDVEQWEHLTYDLSPVNKDSIHQHVQVMSLYRGAYLEAYDYWWAEASQYRYAKLWLQKALDMANFYYETNQLEQAKKWFKQITEAFPESEHAHLTLMKIYAHEGNSRQIHAQFKTLQTFLEEEIGVSPQAETLDWYDEWEKNIIK